MCFGTSVCVVSAKVVHMNPLSPTVTLTHSSAILTSSLSISRENIAISVLINLVSRGVEQIADGGFTVLQIAAGLLSARYRAMQETANKTPIPIPVVRGTHTRSWRALCVRHHPIALTVVPFVSLLQLLAGHQLALEWCLNFLTPDFPTRQAAATAQTVGAASASSPLPHPVATISVSNLPAMLALIRSQLMSKQPLLQLSSDDRHALSVQVLQSFLRGIQRHPGVGEFASNVRVHGLPVGMEGGFRASSVIEGVVIDIPLPIHRTILALCADASKAAPSSRANAAGLRKYVNLRVALYNINLTFAESEHIDEQLRIAHVGGKTKDEDQIDEPSYQAAVYGLMRSLVDRWMACGVSLVAAQKVLHPYLKQLLLERSIVPLERLSIRHIDAVRQASGATILSGIETTLVQPGVLGSLASIEEKVFGRRRYLVLTPAAAAPGSPSAAGVSTFLLSAPTLLQQTELVALVSRIFKLLTNVLRVPAVCAGAGATEMQMAQEIRRRLRDRQDREAREHAAQLHEIKSQVRKANEANRAALIAQDAALSPAVLADLSELAALDRSLRVAHLSRRQRHSGQLHDSILHVASVLEDVACFAPWRSRVSSAEGASGSEATMLEEFKDSMRQYHEQTQAQTASDQQGETKTTATQSGVADFPSVTLAALPATHSVPSSLPQPPSASDVQRLASEPESAPLPIPQWHLRSAWQLDVETRSAVAFDGSVLLARPLPPLVCAPHSLYGYHAQHATPTVVYRREPDNGALQLDSASVLDPLYVKRATLSMAIEATAALMRVQQLVHAQV